jgi:hypothetical protein
MKHLELCIILKFKNQPIILDLSTIIIRSSDLDGESSSSSYLLMFVGNNAGLVSFPSGMAMFGSSSCHCRLLYGYSKALYD